MKIKDVIGREILDSRGNPTVEVDVILENGIIGRASVPSGASTGSKEAIELRDKDKKRYNGKGVLMAVNNVNSVIKPRLIGMDVTEQETIDKMLIELDGTKNKSILGANATLGVSLACLKAAALFHEKPLYQYVGGGTELPAPMMNIINGGAHASNNLDFQEFMIIPQAKNIRERIRVGAEVFHALKKILDDHGQSTAVGDEGGFAPNLKSNKAALELMSRAVTAAGYKLGEDVKFALDVAASEFYQDGKYHLKSENKVLSNNELIEYYVDLVNKYPIVSIEDGMHETDYEGFSLLTAKLGDKIQLVGDDLFVTNKEVFLDGISKGICNSILLKANQIGTITEMLETIKIAKDNNYKTIISHRSGETEDNFIADLAVGLNLGQIKTGSLSRTDRLCKYNQLIRIEEAIERNKYIWV